MLKKKLASLLLIVSLCVVSLIIEAVPNSSQNSSQRNSGSISPKHPTDAERDEVMKEDEIDNTDVYAIPFDSSEIEDEEEINRLERKKMFDIGR